jgi:hypothetical protein
MRRRTLLVALAGLAVVVAAGVVTLRAMSDPAARITVKNYNRIREGMSRAEVEGIIGPPGDYTTHPTYGYVGSGPWEPQPGEESWLADEAVIKVQFDGTSKVVRALFSGNIAKPANGTEAILWRAKRQWRRWFP